ncbi:hypothetical protein [Dyella japonica]|uniref:Uncharacterized protein n=1 Tax=Dyella japonica TaxID=231455 RepID=A0ABV2JS21_9GAMM
MNFGKNKLSASVRLALRWQRRRDQGGKHSCSFHDLPDPEDLACGPQR